MGCYERCRRRKRKEGDNEQEGGGSGAREEQKKVFKKVRGGWRDAKHMCLKVTLAAGADDKDAVLVRNALQCRHTRLVGQERGVAVFLKWERRGPTGRRGCS